VQRIRVLIYTDYYNPSDPGKNITLEPADPHQAPFGLSLMRDLILTYKNLGSDIEINLVNRNIPYHGAQKLTTQLLRCYDELWVFGYYQKDMEKYEPNTGGPENELIKDEKKALRKWMDDGGGVLITGDHSDTKSGPLLNLGRALGQGIPRAGEMRQWEGENQPPVDGRNSFNTQSPGREPILQKLELQEDAEPQHILLEPDRIRFPFPQTSPMPHKLFSGGSTGKILVFPDHMHEGRLLIPKADNEEVWPKEAKQPFVVAIGHDKRICPPTRYDLVSVYDGHLGKVGRIVADSSWHHYLNINLRGLRFDRGDVNAPRSQIGQYYANLVNWLAPRHIQGKLISARLYAIATHPQVLEVVSSAPYTLGDTVKYVMQTECRPSELQELLQSSIPKELVGQEESFDFIPPELILGTLVKTFHEAITSIGTGAEEKLTDEKERDALVTSAFKDSLKIHLEETQHRSEVIEHALDFLPSSATTQGNPYQQSQAIDENHKDEGDSDDGPAT
jgi:hypothetical protein